MNSHVSEKTDNEIVFYQADNLDKIEVCISRDTVWLTQAQMSKLFLRDVSVISRHIRNAFNEGELEKESNLHFLQIPNSDKPVTLFSLDVIISVGYRVKSKRGTTFRIWANHVLKEYILRGAAVNQRFENVEKRLLKNEQKLLSVEDKMDSLLQTALPPKQGVFFQGQIFDAYLFVADLIRSAEISIILIDNYVNDSVLTLLNKRAENVAAIIGVNKISAGLQLDLHKHNAQYPPITVHEIAAIHDRFLLIDGKKLYTFGASFKDLGKKLFCFSAIESEEVIKWIAEKMAMKSCLRHHIAHNENQ